MDRRYFKNPFSDLDVANSDEFLMDEKKIKHHIKIYVEAILENNPAESNADKRGDIYVGNAGIAYMFLKLAECEQTCDMYPALNIAAAYIDKAKANARDHRKSSMENYSFLCGNAGIYAVSAAISSALQNRNELAQDLNHFKSGIAACQEHLHTKYGCDEVLVGRAGYLSGCYWLNDVLPSKKIKEADMIAIYNMVLDSGREYSRLHKSPLPLLYSYHGTEYVGAAHGLCAILHMLLDSPLFQTSPISAPENDIRDIKASIDYLLDIQDKEGNFPIGLEDLRTGRDKRLVHWCHGAPGIVYMLAKAYMIFQDEKYVNALRRSSDLVWRRGFLRKGPGICHGVAGNGYVFLLQYRLTHDVKYLYRAYKFMELLEQPDFKKRARTPDRPYSLYEGIAGTVCFLIDLLQPERAHFPFMEVFH